MNLLNNLSIGKKIAIIVVAAVLGFVFLLVVVNGNISKNAERMESLQESHYPLLLEAKSNEIRLDQLANGISNSAMIGESDVLEQATTHYHAIEKSLSAMADLGANQRELKKLKQEVDAYYQAASGMARGMIEGTANMATMAAQANQVNQSLDVAKSALHGFAESARMAVEQVVEEANETSVATVWTGRTIGLVTLLIVIGIGFAISRNLVGAVNGVANSLKEIAKGEGDLTVRLDHKGKDELGRMVYYFNEFVTKLQESMRDVVDSVQGLHVVSEELSESSAAANSQITSQGEAINQTTTALNELFTSVKHIAEHAAEASESAGLANEEATKGSSVVQETVSSINELASEIEQTSEEIVRLESYTDNVGSILDTIRGIAEQTNLLALNAAIEAARAGEQGRGFAVVADEVRSLASRTQDSTQEIQQVLEELQGASKSAVAAMSRGTSKAGSSVDQSATAGESLLNITDKVGGIVDINTQIAAATEEQNQTSELISQYVEDIQTMAQDAISSTSKLDGVSQSIQELSERLNTVANQFRV